jgi:lysophospholipase L1-like esterase
MPLTKLLGVTHSGACRAKNTLPATLKSNMQLAMIFIGATVVFILIEVSIVILNGKKVARPTPQPVQTIGRGKKLVYVVLGDSTSAGQGSNYADSFVTASSQHLAKRFTVQTSNFSVPGATIYDIEAVQLDQALSLKPDIVLISAGANDVTHFTRGRAIEASLQRIIDQLKKTNPTVQVIVTGSPAVDSVSRFPWGARQLMELQTKQINIVFDRLIKKNTLIHAPIAKETRSAFLADPTLTASDNFHPNARGYALWIPIITAAIDKAVSRLNTFE